MDGIARLPSPCVRRRKLFCPLGRTTSGALPATLPITYQFSDGSTVRGPSGAIGTTMAVRSEPAISVLLISVFISNRELTSPPRFLPDHICLPCVVTLYAIGTAMVKPLVHKFQLAPIPVLPVHWD